MEARSYESIVEDLRNYQTELEVQNEELRTAQADLAQAKRKYQHLWERAPIGFIIHTRTGEIESANNRAIELLDLSMRPAQSLWNCFPVVQASLFHRNLRAYLKSGNSRPIEVQLHSRIGKPSWLLAETIAIEEGLLQTALIDISERKAAEQKSELMMGQLRHAQKMEILNQMSSGIAHDFNNILQIVLINAELAANKIDDSDETLKGLVKDIRESASRGSDLTRRLLAFGRNNPLTTERKDLNGVLSECLKIIRRTFSKEIQLNLIASDRDVPVLIDVGQIEQVLLNLCLNARDAMTNGGTITISCDRETLDERFEMFGLSVPAGEYAVMEVADTGHGFAENDLYKVFEPFFTSKPVGQGTGLGLSIVYGVVQQHGGAIRLQSSGEGTRFQVLIPYDGIGPATAKKTQAPSQDTTVFETFRILLVEDEPVIRRAMSDALVAEGMEVVTADMGIKAIEIIQQSVANFDILISDVVMPDVGGKEVCQVFRDRFPQADIVLVSGHGDSVLDTRFLTRYNANFLAKPFSVNDLMKCINKITMVGSYPVDGS